MVQSQPLPTSAELPCSDDTPVDNEDQNFIPNLLLFLLESIWATRNDWFFGVDMGVYHTTGVIKRMFEKSKYIRETSLQTSPLQGERL